MHRCRVHKVIPFGELLTEKHVSFLLMFPPCSVWGLQFVIFWSLLFFIVNMLILVPFGSNKIKDIDMCAIMDMYKDISPGTVKDHTRWPPFNYELITCPLVDRYMGTMWRSRLFVRCTIGPSIFTVIVQVSFFLMKFWLLLFTNKQIYSPSVSIIFRTYQHFSWKL